MMKALRIIAVSILALTLLFSVSYFYLVYKNNINTPRPSKQEIQQALDKSTNWVLKNQDEVLKINNPVIWWFITKSAALTDNYELSRLARKYGSSMVNKNSPWAGYWKKKSSFAYITGSLDYLEEYQRFFIYALSCDTDLGDEKIIQEQFNLNYCDWRPYYSSCITHQLMGIRLLQIKNCGDQNLNRRLSTQLTDLVEKQLIWDPRVGDVYIQRTLMLVESGNQDKVKSIWLRNILDAQQDDGGWASFDKILPVPDDKYFGFSYKFVDIRKPVSNLHPTAQAIYLLSLVSKQYAD